LIGECAARQLSDEALESQGSYLLAGLKTPHVLFAPAASEARNREGAATHKTPDLRLISGGHH
jgi:adenylate cyclase